MRALVLGGTGFSGPHVVRRLCALGHDVAVFHRGTHEPALPPEVRHIHDPTIAFGDRRLAAHTDAFHRFAPQLVLDMLAMNEQDAQATVGAFGSLARRLVLISSQDVYRVYGRLHGSEPGPLENLPVTEESPLRESLYPYRSDPPRAADDPRRGMDLYDKIPVERLFMSAPRATGTILRLPAVYGPGDAQHRLFGYLKRMDDKRPAIILAEGLAGWRWTRGYVENVGQAIALAVHHERGAGRIYNVGEMNAFAEAEWVRAIGRAAGWDGQVVVLPEDRLPEDRLPEAMRPGFDTRHHFVSDSSRIRAELGYRESISSEEALRRTVEWEREHPPAEIDPTQFDYAAEDKIIAALGA